MNRRFIKTKEDFKCEHCGESVIGSGYTNHCPKCLWSKHVDVNPGDRAGGCLGMMKPVSVVYEKNNYILSHECERCGAKKNNAVSDNDDMDAVIKLSKQVASSQENKNPRLKM